ARTTAVGRASRAMSPLTTSRSRLRTRSASSPSASPERHGTALGGRVGHDPPSFVSRSFRPCRPPPNRPIRRVTMLSTQTLIRTLVVVLALPVLWFLAPLQLHGHTGYAIVSGISMEPRFHGGDLVLIHEQPSYHVGQVVAYR